MFSRCLVLFVFFAEITCEPLQIWTSTRSSYLEKFYGYGNVDLLQITIPSDTDFASFMFVADEMDLSIFGCSVRNVSLYMTHGSPPVINPDGSDFPKLFKNITRSHLYHLEFKTDKRKEYVNITSPRPGSYFISTFLTYTNPKYNAIQQDGLRPRCMPFVEAKVYISKIQNPIILMDDQRFEVRAKANERRVYKFYIPESIDHVIIELRNIHFSRTDIYLTINIQSSHVPSENNSQKYRAIPANESSADILVWVEEMTWSYIEIIFNLHDTDAAARLDLSSLNIMLHYFSNKLTEQYSKIFEKNDNITNDTTLYKLHRSNKLTEIVPYQQYNLVRVSSTDSFVFSYELEQEVDASLPIAINITNQHFTVLQFPINGGSDVGGTLQYILAFKPRLKSKRTFTKEPEDHVIIGCIRANHIEVPTWPNKCVFDNKETNSPLILNKTVDNSTVLVPYPEAGIWYASFKLFCGVCKPCNCSHQCQKLFETCNIDCELSCGQKENCSKCLDVCTLKVVKTKNCEGCDCEGPCRRNYKICNTSIIFDVSSQPCLSGECSDNGRCMFIISSGIVYSTCICGNKYRGWDCSDGSQATPMVMVYLELFLLVLSNFAFLPSIYFAYQRKYYVEALTYSSILFFSTFYHACDAGEHIISFCITRITALQFADFFCALLSIWVTLIAIAHLPMFWPSIFHILGAIILAFCTTIDKTSLWVFALPAVTGLLVICGNWYLKYREHKQMFLNKVYAYIYLPIGVVVVVIGLFIYSLLQTEDNYKYLHSMWHVIMAVAVVILLPRQDTFLPIPLGNHL